MNEKDGFFGANKYLKTGIFDIKQTRTKTKRYKYTERKKRKNAKYAKTNVKNRKNANTKNMKITKKNA